MYKSQNCYKKLLVVFSVIAAILFMSYLPSQAQLPYYPDPYYLPTYYPAPVIPDYFYYGLPYVPTPVPIIAPALPSDLYTRTAAGLLTDLLILSSSTVLSPTTVSSLINTGNTQVTSALNLLALGVDPLLVSSTVNTGNLTLSLYLSSLI